MENKTTAPEYDVIVIGSGTGGATVARELSKKNKKVLILEQGKNRDLNEKFLSLAGIVNEISVSDKMASMRAITTGGSSAIYAAIAELPPLDAFAALGIDISAEIESVKAEIPLTRLSDDILAPQALKLRESARGLGYPWQKNLMLIDERQCTSGYSYEAKWKAKSYVDDATASGATLINQAIVIKIIIENNKAIGVEYKWKGELKKVYGNKIVLAAGVLATPLILRNSGIKNVVNHGFYCNPGFLMFGIIPGLKGRDNFVGAMSADLGDGIVVGDANLTSTFYKIIMLAKLKFGRAFSFPNAIAVGGVIEDGLAGELKENGKYYKKLTQEEYKKLDKAEAAAKKILVNAGAKNIFHSGLDAGNLGGVLRIHEHLDGSLQTQYENLYVCDGSIIPENIRIYPTVTLICLGKYLAKHLLSKF